MGSDPGQIVMSIWGKLTGAAAGLAVGGPIGALIGGVAGHLAIDHGIGSHSNHDKQVAFTVGVIALGRENGEGRWRCDER